MIGDTPFKVWCSTRDEFVAVMEACERAHIRWSSNDPAIEGLKFITHFPQGILCDCQRDKCLLHTDYKSSFDRFECAGMKTLSVGELLALEDDNQQVQLGNLLSLLGTEIAGWR